MNEFGSVWGYQEMQNLDQLKQNVMMARLELEEVKKKANDERMKNEMTIDQLQIRLKALSQERDEAISQLQKHLKLFHAQTQPGNPVVVSGKTNPSITNTNSPNELSNHQSIVGSFDTMSPDFSTMNVPSSTCTGFAKHVLLPRQLAYLGSISLERATACFNEFTLDRKPPPTGKLALIMKELSNYSFCGLSITSPHPPERSQCTPHVPVNGPENRYTNQNPVTCSQLCSTPVLNFATLGSGSCMSSGRLSAPDIGMSNQIPVAKHPRIT